MMKTPQAAIGRQQNILHHIVHIGIPSEHPAGQMRDFEAVGLDDLGERTLFAPASPLDQQPLADLVCRLGDAHAVISTVGHN